MGYSRVVQGINDLESYCKKNNLDCILESWDCSNNGGLLPSEISYGSKRSVNWICPNGHSYSQQINAKVSQKQNCPYCSGKKVLPGYNDLATRFPHLAKEWSVNNRIPPSQVNPGTKACFEWVCTECGYSWSASVSNRTRLKSGCPACAGEVAIKGKNDLSTVFPQIASEWDWTRNEKGPDEYKAKSHKEVYWLCPVCGNSYRMRIQSRTDQNQGCIRCAKRLQTSFPEQAIFYYMQKSFPDTENGCRTALDGKYEIDIYIPSKRTGIEYDGARWHRDTHTNDKNKYEACRKKGIYLIRVCEIQLDSGSLLADRIIVSNYNQGKKLECLVSALNELFQILEIKQEIDIERDELKIRENYYQELKKNSAGALYPELLKEWNQEENGDITLFMLSPQDGNVKYSWKCSGCGNVWKTTVYHRAIRKQNCRICGYRTLGEKVSKKRIEMNGSLQDNFPIIAKEWDFDKNVGVSPVEVAAYENVKRWWICPRCKQSYDAKVSDRTKKNSGCPYCSGKRPIIGQNDLATTHPQIIRDWDYDKNGSPTNYKAGSNKQVWWRCHVCGYEWQTPVYSRAQNGRGCKECLRRKRNLHRK